MIRGALGRWWSTPRTRQRVARVLVVAGIALVLLAFATTRWGLVFAGILLIGFGAAAGPARIRRGRTEPPR
ncbi:MULTISPECIES: hypothetical protein [unclassified Agromyces]|uniref:hypothetical protein n=1 Tax=unclassified Agromyces TaxID=2639701 RepID=UPI0030149AF1